MESKNVTEIYSQLAKGTFLEQDRTSNFPGENIKAWEEYCETSLDLCELEEVSEDCRDLNADQLYAAMYGAIQKLIQKVETLESEVQN